MLRDVALIAVIAATAALAQSDGTKQEPDSFDVEPPLLIPNRADASLPATSSEANPQDVDLAKLEKAFERARRNAAGAEHLYRIGVISQVEAEQTAAEKRERAEVDAAEANLHRQQRLLAVGSAQKSDVTRAQEKLAELKAPKN